MLPAISITDLVFTWPGAIHPTLDIKSWQVEAGKRIFLYGPSGCGKTTLLNLISAMAAPSSGKLSVAGNDLHRLGRRHGDRFRARTLGIIFQQFNLIPYLSVADNIRLGAFFSQTRHSGPAMDQLMTSLITQLGLPSALLDAAASKLSVGQQQRIAIARALIHSPSIIIADEPSSALDTDAQTGFIQALLDCAETHGSTVIFVSHDQCLATHFDESVNLQTLNAIPCQAPPEHTCRLPTGNRGNDVL